MLNDNITPELTRCPLSKIGLAIKLLHLGDIQTFLEKAIDPPPVEAVNSVITMLKGILYFIKMTFLLNINVFSTIIRVWIYMYQINEKICKI